MSRRLFALVLLLFAFASLTAAQVRPTRVRVSAGVMQGMVVKKVPPDYPPDAREAKVQGVVLLQVTISKSGDVENIQLISGHPMLAQAAIDAVKQWKYKPYLLNGVAVAVETQVQINFTLADKPPSGTAGNVTFGPSGGVATQAGEVAEPADVGLHRPPKRIRVSEKVEQALLEKKVQPVYPQAAKDQHVRGVVVMKMIVGKDGNVENLEVVTGDPLLAPSSLDAVRQWKYKPYLLNNRPVEVETQVQVNYTLLGL